MLIHNCDIVWVYKFICKNLISEYYSFRNSISIYFSLLTSIYNFCTSKVALWAKKIQSFIFTYRFMGLLTFIVNLAGFRILRETHLWGCLLGHFQTGLTWGRERRRGTFWICTAPSKLMDWGPELSKNMNWAFLPNLSALTVAAMWPAILCSCAHAFPATINCIT